ncbi:FAD:protein FMN transferase [Kineosporia succinea]|uniref:FAD:protein FMN transferase n=1 Tax=Kineosporia succinea TaxID=84632 RepID=A0ABT9P0X6_9ACTN|nr:FAD:protein FMN transferase [Kineosporia succinea]MDP9826329.1 thiamine biosynthesis lipoprotein [Kineosporia succinea]
MAITDIVRPGLRRNEPVSENPVSGDRSRTAAWQAWGTTASVTVDDPAALNVARRIVSRQFAAAEKAAARFRSDAELHKLYRAGGRPVTISPLLAQLVASALAVAERTDGDIDPTVAAALTAHGTIGADRPRGVFPACGSRPTGTRPAPGWEHVRLEGRKLQVPAGTTLDLSATAKAAICDLAAARVRERLDTGVMVRLGGNAATAGPAPDQGWRVRIEDRAGDLGAEVFLTPGAAISTTQIGPQPARSQHITLMIDPHTGEMPLPVWRMVSAIGFTCLEATTYSTAALVRGTRARSWLSQMWIPARLITTADDELLSGNWANHTTPYAA